MNTTDNRALVSAQLIRAALHEIDESTDTDMHIRMVADPVRYHGALESLAAVAGELEGSVASSAQGVSPTPDPQFVSDMLEVFLAASDGEVGAGPTFAAFCAKHGDGRDIEAACRDALRSHIAELRATPAASSSSVTATEALTPSQRMMLLDLARGCRTDGPEMAAVAKAVRICDAASRAATATPLCNDCGGELTKGDGFTHCAACRHRRDQEHASHELTVAISIAINVEDGLTDLDSLDPYTRERVGVILAVKSAAARAATATTEPSETDAAILSEAARYLGGCSTYKIDTIASRAEMVAAVRRAAARVSSGGSPAPSEDTARLDELGALLAVDGEDVSLLGTSRGGVILSTELYPSVRGFPNGIRSTLDELAKLRAARTHTTEQADG